MTHTYHIQFSDGTELTVTAESKAMARFRGEAITMHCAINIKEVG